MPYFFDKEIAVFGCGNILFGDDGFGVEAVKYLKENYKIPENVEVIEAGISIRGILFNLTLSEKKPKKIIIVDAVDAGLKAGEIFPLDIDDIPTKKIDDFSMHQMPTSNLLKELKNLCEVEIKVFAIQVEEIPEEVKPGISEKLKGKIKEFCDILYKELLK